MFTLLVKDLSWARLNGEIQFVDSLELKEDALNNKPVARDILKTVDNPIYELFYIHRGVASLHDNMGVLIEEMEI